MDEYEICRQFPVTEWQKMISKQVKPKKLPKGFKSPSPRRDQEFYYAIDMPPSKKSRAMISDLITLGRSSVRLRKITPVSHQNITFNLQYYLLEY